jgi:hypothetical protein
MSSAGLPINTSVIVDIADAVGEPPVNLGLEYLGKCARASEFLGSPSDAASLALSSSTTLVTKNPSSSSNVSTVILNGIMDARNHVFDMMNRIATLYSSPQSANFTLPSNPFLKISALNSRRVSGGNISLSDSDAQSIGNDITFCLNLIRKQSRLGVASIPQSQDVVQLSSVEMSLRGFGGSGDNAVSLLSFVPAAVAGAGGPVSENSNIFSPLLSPLDFKNRIPKILFISSYSPSGRVEGSVVAWKRVPDASGYIIKRRDIFTSEEVSFSFSNDDISSKYVQIEDYVKSWILGFYDTVNPESIFAFLDSTTKSDAYYQYTVQCYQISKQPNDSIFNVGSTIANLTSVQKDSIRSMIVSFANSGSVSTTSVSPYPFLSEFFLGSSQYDWLLAGLNVRQSISRGDDADSTRKYSYLTADLLFIFQQMDRQKFVVPNNFNDIIANVQSSIVQFGISQVVQEIILETGISFFLGGGQSSILGLNASRFTSTRGNQILTTISSAIDPETATLDLDSLASNLSILLNMSDASFVSSLATGLSKVPSQAQSTPSEFSIPANFNEAPQTAALNSSDRFLSSLGSSNSHIVDLTTFDGISDMIRTIRIFSDIGLSKVAPT